MGLRFVKFAALAMVLATGFVGAGAEAKVKGQKATYKVGDQEFTGYLAYDDATGGKRPGVVVVHEWWGHDAYARRRAEVLAANGYTAIALDMYGTGKHADHPKDAKAFMMEAVKSADVMQARFRAAYDLLKKQDTVDGSKIAAIGYCFGGKVVLDMARMGVDLKGVASFHGNLTPAVKAKRGVTMAKVRVFNGADDGLVKSEAISALRAEMARAGVDYQIVNYPGAVHSFTNPGATEKGKKFKMPLAYNAAADGDSWQKTLVFFEEIFSN
ncbi:MAG: dienelactone hydrolase family protein [Rhodospirillaceae bacterium]